MTRSIKPISSKGFNLVEAAIVLGVIGLVIGGIWVAAAAVSDNQKQQKIQQDIGHLASSLTISFKDLPAPPGTGTTNLGNYIIAQNLLPGWSFNGTYFSINNDHSLYVLRNGANHATVPGTVRFRIVSSRMPPNDCVSITRAISRQRTTCIGSISSMNSLRGDVISLNAFNTSGVPVPGVCTSSASLCTNSSNPIGTMDIHFLP